MVALITGASGGIGTDLALELAKKNIDLILVARNENKLKALKAKIEGEYQVNVNYFACDLTNENEIENLVNNFSNIDILINNAGRGTLDKFYNINLDDDLKTIKLNITALHYLTKRYLEVMLKNNFGYIMNVSSTASFQPGPIMATYYASKAYVTSLTEAIAFEIQKEKKKIYISTLCPGPTKTDFNKLAGVKRHLSEQSSSEVAKYAIKMMFKKKRLIIPSLKLKIGLFFERFLSKKMILKIIFATQRKKQG